MPPTPDHPDAKSEFARDYRGLERASRLLQRVWSWWVKKYQPKLAEWAIGLGASPEAAEDIVQLVLFAVFRHISRGKPVDLPEPYLRKVVTNRVRKELGRSAKGPVEVSIDHEEEGIEPEDPYSTPAAVKSAEFERDLENDLGLLRPQYQAVFLLNAYGMKDEAIAVAMGRPVGTVKTWLRRARRKLIEIGSAYREG